MARRAAQNSTKIGRRILYLIIIGGLVAAGVHYKPLFEWQPPVVKVELARNAVGLTPFDVKVSDVGRGLREVTVVLAESGGEHVLEHKVYAQPQHEDTLKIQLDPKKEKLQDGRGTLKVVVVDRSYWRFFAGNQTLAERSVQVDLTPPNVQIIDADHYVNFGGSGVVIYKVSPDTVTSGVSIGKYFFAGAPAHFADPTVYIAYFAHPYNTPKTAKPMVIAEDAAGNRGEASFYYVLKDRHYRSRSIKISDDFIRRKVMPLLAAAGQTGITDPVKAFLAVNRGIRQENAAEIQNVCSKSSDKQLWSGAFLQLKDSKVEARFADHRTYYYHKRPIDKEYHLGFDLAAVSNDPIGAANSGIIVFAHRLGIYGNAVIIDHGQGLFTLYAHLSSIDVKVGDKVKKGQRLGLSGQTGLAGGDHLHFAVLVDGVPVLPLEWWDPNWIKINVTRKIGAAAKEFGGTAAAGPMPPAGRS